MNIKRLPEPVKKIFRPAYYKLYLLKLRILSLFQKKIDPKDIPIIINNRNRVSSLIELIAALEQRGYTNLYIIDNASTYPPLLEYYKQCRYKIFRLDSNIGFLALWETGIYRQFINRYYVYTDSDVVPIAECPDDFLEVFLKALQSDNSVQKVGFSLKIDDLPDHFKNKLKVIEWERQFFEKKTPSGFYEANIDTTFALYRPGLKAGANRYWKMYRSAYPYEARHLPWYVDSDNLSEEERYYVQHATTSTHWTSQVDH